MLSERHSLDCRYGMLAPVFCQAAINHCGFQIPTREEEGLRNLVDELVDLKFPNSALMNAICAVKRRHPYLQCLDRLLKTFTVVLG